MSAKPHTGGLPKRVWTPEQDELVRRIFSTTSMKARRDAMTKLLPQLAPIDHVAAYKRAVDLGCLYPLKAGGAPWTEPELAILEASAHCPIDTIRSRLRRRGYRRSNGAIIKQRLERHGTRAECRLSADVYSASQAADLIGSQPCLIGSYIRRGWLRAEQIDMAAGRYEYHIRAADLRQFVMQHTAYVNLERVDKYAFVDLLCPGHGAKGGAEKPARQTLRPPTNITSP